MNEHNYNPHDSNWNNPYMNQGEQKLPKSGGSFILGIISLCVSVICFCCCGGFASLITSIIGIVLGNKAIRNYKENPGVYSEKSYKKAKAGRTMSWIAFILAILSCIYIIGYAYLGETGQLPPELQDSYEENQRKWDFD